MEAFDAEAVIRDIMENGLFSKGADRVRSLLTQSESGQGTPEGRGSSLAGALADGSPLGSTPEAKAGSAVPAGAAGTPRWREKDPDSGDDLIELWKKRPRYSDEYAAAEIIEWLERELAEAQRDNRILQQRSLDLAERNSVLFSRSASGVIAKMNEAIGRGLNHVFFEDGLSADMHDLSKAEAYREGWRDAWLEMADYLAAIDRRNET